MTPPLVPADDRGLTLGVGLFETILFVDGAPRFWGAHLDRLRRGCADLGLPPPEAAALAEAALAALAAAGVAQGRAAVRLSWTGGAGARGLEPPADPAPRLFAHAARAAEPPVGLTLATAGVRRNPTSPASRMKTLSYLDNVEARREARSAGAQEALLLDTAGRIACAAAGNVVWLDGGRLCTPSATCGALAGVVRGEALRRAGRWGLAACEVEAGPQALASSQGGFVTNSLVGGVPLLALDGAPLPQPPAWLRDEMAALAR